MTWKESIQCRGGQSDESFGPRSLRHRACQTLAWLEPVAAAVCDYLSTKGKIPDCSGAGCFDLCRGLVSEDAPEIVDIVGDLTGASVCALIGLCDPLPPPPEPCQPGIVPVRTDISDRTGERTWPVRWQLN